MNNLTVRVVRKEVHSDEDRANERDRAAFKFNDSNSLPLAIPRR